jgi:ATP phosphoribosyltransferase
MELAPLTGLADAIVDLVASGQTLKANALIEVEEIMQITARLVVNKAALKLDREPVRALIDSLAAAVAAAQRAEAHAPAASVDALQAPAASVAAPASAKAVQTR